VGVGVVDGGGMSEMGKSFTALGSTEENSVGSSWGTKGKLVESDALSSSGDDTLSGGLSERKSTYRQLWYLKHAYIVGYLSNNNGNLSVLVLHVLRKTVKSDRRLVDLGHMKTLYYGCAKLRISTTSKELIKLDQKTIVRVGGLDDLH